MEALDRLFSDLGWRSTLLMIGVLALVPLVIIIIAMNLPWQATFSINAQTEVVEFETGRHNVPNWFITAERMRIDGADFGAFSGQIEIGRETRVRLVRLETGRLRLTLEQTGQELVATLYDQAESRLATARERLQAIVSLPQGEAVTLPIAGRAVIGDTIFSQSVETSPVLIAGHVQVFGRYVIGKNRFAAQQAPLDSGDRLEIDYSNTAPGGHGLLRIQQDEPGLRVVFHADADAVRVIRFGTAGSELSPSLWARVSADPLYQSLLAIYAVLLPAIGLALASLFNQFRLRQITRKKCPPGQVPAAKTARSEPAGASEPENRGPDNLQSTSKSDADPESARRNSSDNDDANK